MAFHVDHTAVNVYSNGFEIATIKLLLEYFEIDFSEHMGCFVAEVA